MNMTLHVGFVHGNPSCNTCGEFCYGNCIIREHEEIALDYNTSSTRDQGDTDTLPTTQPIASAYNKPAETHMSLAEFSAKTPHRPSFFLLSITR